MKCVKHNAEPIGVCAYCGRAVCPECAPDHAVPRLVCSPSCAAALARADDAIQTILQRAAHNAQASAFYCYICAGLSAAAAIAAWFMAPSPFLIAFTAGCAIVLLVSGLWYARGAKRK